jgi:hypothetical protein
MTMPLLGSPMAQRDVDRRLRSALSYSVPAAPLAAIHRRARMAAARDRLNTCALIAIVCAISIVPLSEYTGRNVDARPVVRQVMTPAPMPAPAPIT